MRAAGLVVVAAAVLAAPSLGSCGGLAAVTDGSDGASHGDGDGTVRRDAATGGDSATGDDAAADDAIADVGSDVVYTDDCPASPPADGASCSEPGRMCEYGGSWWLACDRALVCNGGAWSTRYDGSCAWLDGGACPATYGEAADAGLCASGDCDYPEGHCSCLGYCGGPPPPGPIQPAWSCTPAPKGCPWPRPRAGTLCTTEGQTCGYSFGCCGGTILQCRNGAWFGSEPTPCE